MLRHMDRKLPPGLPPALADPQPDARPGRRPPARGRGRRARGGRAGAGRPRPPARAAPRRPASTRPARRRPSVRRSSASTFPGSLADTCTRTRSPRASPKRRRRPSTSRPRSKSPRAACSSASLRPARPRGQVDHAGERGPGAEQRPLVGHPEVPERPVGAAQLGRHDGRLLGVVEALGRPDPRQAVVLLGRTDHLPARPGAGRRPGGRRPGRRPRPAASSSKPTAGVHGARPVVAARRCRPTGVTWQPVPTRARATSAPRLPTGAASGAAGRPVPASPSTRTGGHGRRRDEGPGAVTPGPSAELPGAWTAATRRDRPRPSRPGAARRCPRSTGRRSCRRPRRRR